MLFLTFLVAVIINFVGYVPVGNINLTTVQISVNRGLKQALCFVTTFAVVEGFFTYVLMRFAEWFSRHKELLIYLDWILIMVFLILGTLSLRAATRPKEVIFKKRDSIRYGVILGIFNPMQIPYWMIGGTYLISHNWITTEGWGLEIFGLGAAIGAFLCLYTFARFAKYIQERFALSNRIINRAIAVVFFILAGFHICKIAYHTLS
jgi:threonine/homoserine/homoserine lactone efflux protein